MYRTEKIESWGKYRDTYHIVRGGGIVSAQNFSVCVRHFVRQIFGCNWFQKCQFLSVKCPKQHSCLPFYLSQYSLLSYFYFAAPFPISIGVLFQSQFRFKDATSYMYEFNNYIKTFLKIIYPLVSVLLNTLVYNFWHLVNQRLFIYFGMWVEII